MYRTDMVTSDPLPVQQKYLGMHDFVSINTAQQVGLQEHAAQTFLGSKPNRYYKDEKQRDQRRSKDVQPVLTHELVKQFFFSRTDARSVSKIIAQTSTNLIIAKTKNSVTLVRERTTPTKRPPLVGKVSANFLRIKGVAWSAQRIPPVVNLSFLDRSLYFSFK
jgi:hypothetical protein